MTIMNETILWIIGAISVIVPAVLMFLQWRGVRLYDKRLESTTICSTACAGSEHLNTPKELGIVDLCKYEFNDENNKPINLNEYECVVACGWSMLLGGIDDEDLLLVKPVENIGDLQFPSILIIERDEFSKKSAVKYNDYAENKVRRSWSLCDMSKENPIDVMTQCMKMDEYVRLSKKYIDKFQSVDAMIKDFERRVEIYKEIHLTCQNVGDDNQMAVISTTYDTQKQIVHFSIHPVKDIKGEVYYSFHLHVKKAA
jgi:hypothetical protein